MPAEYRPHVLGVDDAPFDKAQAGPVPIVAVTLEAADRVEGVAIGAFPVDGEDATGYLAGWIATLRTRPSLQAVMLGGITMAGLGVVDLPRLAECTGLPVLAVTRRRPDNAEVLAALRAAGLAHRAPVVERTPAAHRVADGLYVACAGADRWHAERLVRATLGKSRLPEPLRVAHMIAGAIATGESRGRV
ncbi:MAG TPA: DUF99 family protein [Gemmatimonadales bacterium]|jgi:endonuclease V-like protein UPF0215 family|nr:DUF99 family protein [Gemmatimonadales bacterium]